MNISAVILGTNGSQGRPTLRDLTTDHLEWEALPASDHHPNQWITPRPRHYLELLDTQYEEPSSFFEGGNEESLNTQNQQEIINDGRGDGQIIDQGRPIDQQNPPLNTHSNLPD